jgi:Zn-dependent protease with chaperone function
MSFPSDAPSASPAAARVPVYESPIRVERWPSEVPLLVVVGLISLGVWLLAAITIVGLIYAAFLCAFFFVAHVVFVAHVRGNGVRLGPDQFPELHETVQRLSRRMGLNPVPETYLMQAGGTLNAFATKFLRSNVVVLFSDLLQACGDDTAARDMIIAHELGHIRAGHLRWTWFLLPGTMVPFLGMALSRAREYTCDRYGLEGAGRRDSALVGLAILAAGGKYGPLVNREAMVRQRDHMNTGFMRIGEWLSTHPPLADRMAALDPALDALCASSSAGTIRAVGIIGAVCVTPVVIAVIAATALVGLAARFSDGPMPRRSQQQASLEELFAEAIKESQATAAARQRVAEPAVTEAVRQAEPEPPKPSPQFASFGEELTAIQARTDLEALAGVLELERARGEMPADQATLYARVAARRNDKPDPRDPFTGQRYWYEHRGGKYVLTSAGPDKALGTPDDIVRTAR